MARFIASQRDAHGVPQAVLPGAGGVPVLVLQVEAGRAPAAGRAAGAAESRDRAAVRRSVRVRTGRRGSPPRCGMRAGGSARTRSRRLMREQGLAARRKKRRKATTRPGKGRWRAPDQVKRKFAADGINRRWYGDGTEIVTGEGKLYLDSVLDMGSRRIVGFALGARHDAALAYGALAMAVAVRGGAVPGVVFHTDQGSEYTAGSFRAACERLGIAQSMGRPGRRWTTRSSSRGTRRWSSSCGRCAASPPGRPRRPRSRRGSRITTMSAGTPRSGMRSPVDYERSLAGKDAA